MNKSDFKDSKIRKFFPLNTAELLDSVFDVYKESFLRQIGVSVIFNIIITIAVYIIIFVGAIVFISSAVMDSFDFSDHMGIALTVVALVAFVLFLFMVKNMFVTAGNIIISKSVFFGEDCTVGQAVKGALKKFPCIFTVLIADIIISIPLFILLFALIFIYILFFGEIMGYEIAGGIGTGLFVILTVILLLAIYGLSIFISTITSMSYSVAVFEKKYFFSAVKKSWLLAKKNYWKIFALMVVWSFIPSAAGLGITGIIEIASSFMGYFMPDSAYAYFFDTIYLVNTGISYLINILLAPLSGIFSTMLYINQRMHHEGMDLELNLKEIINRQKRKEYEESIARQISQNNGSPVYNLKKSE